MILSLRDWLRRPIGDPREAKLRKRLVTVFFVDAALALILVWLNLMVQHLGYRVENTGRLIEQLDLEHSELMAELSRETAPDRLRLRARDELALDLPSAGQVMTIDGRP